MPAGYSKLLKGVAKLLPGGNLLPAKGIYLSKDGNILQKERFNLFAGGKQPLKGGIFLLIGGRQLHWAGKILFQGGIYFYQLKAGKYVETKKFVLLN